MEKQFSKTVITLLQERENAIKDLQVAIKTLKNGVKLVAEKSGKKSQEVSQVLSCKYYNKDIIDAACEVLNEHYALMKSEISKIKKAVDMRE